MVRVMSVHHFTSQDIHTCEDPLAVTTAPPDLLLLALPQHVIEVRDLAKGGNPTFTFPTVDEVHHMVHSCCGNYVATLESKQSRQGKESIYARIYANWDTSLSQEWTVVQPMRARIAGRVTPSSAQSGTGGLEMIELPIKRTPSAVACCQVTGNLVLASHKTLVLYYFRVRTHDISRLKFIDFEESSVNLELSFTPWKLQLCEDVIACMSKEHLHVLRVGHGEDRWLEQRLEEGALPACEGPGSKRSVDTHLDWDEVINEELQAKSTKNLLEISGTCNLNSKSFPVVVELPDIMSERSSGSTGSPGTNDAVYRHSPFRVAPPEMTVHISCTSPTTGWAEESGVLNILQLQLASPIGSGNSRHLYVGNEEFRCLLLKAMYVKDSIAQKNSKVSDMEANARHLMRSSYHDSLCGIVCLVTTQQEGYLYYFPMGSSQSTPLLQQAACITVYPFTAPVSCVVLENYLLHALTDTGLETYTLRVGHHLLQGVESMDGVNSTCPAWTDPVCLVGLRPFLGVEHLLVSDSYLLLLACSESSSTSSHDSQAASWTLYSLQIPSPSTLYRDIVSMGSVHRWTSPGTYCHLLGEAHIIVRVALAIVFWLPHQERAIAHTDVEEKACVQQLYQESCALLGDYHINGVTEEDWGLATPYYKMSGLSPIQVVERVKNLDIPEEMVTDISKENQVHGLMKYLKTSLLLMNQAASNVSFTPAIPSFTNMLLDLFEEHDPNQVSWLVLQSNLLREYATDRVLNIMKKQLCTRPVPKPSDAVALVLLCIQKGSPEQAMAVLDSLPAEQLTAILLANSALLFDTSPVVPATGAATGTWRSDTVKTFSELSVVLMDAKPEVLASILSSLVTSSNQENMSLQEVLKVFLEYLPSKIGITGSTASFVLQIFLENFFTWYFSLPPTPYDPATVEALKILVRSYLSDLQLYDLANVNRKRLNDANTSSETSKRKLNSMKNFEKLLTPAPVLFVESRPPFLQKMPPFSSNLSKRLILLQSGKKEVEDIDMKPQDGNKQNNESLIKLQALLCSGKLPKECLVEVYQFVQSHPQLHGNLSLQVLCLPPREGSNVLLNFCPQVLLQFAKDKFVGEVEWKYLLLLMQRKIRALSDDNMLKPFYQQVMKECLAYLSTYLSLEDFCRVLPGVLPPGCESSYEHFVRMCQHVNYAKHILSLIMATGQQLLSTLHL